MYVNRFLASLNVNIALIGTKPKSSCMGGKPSTTELHQAQFLLLYSF
jgi:hypothetical protein